MTLPADATVLITGATGLVGSHVVERLRDRGCVIRAMVRSTSGPSVPVQPCVEAVSAELTDASSMQQAVRGVTHIVHCAAKVGDWGPPDEYRRINVAGLQTLIEACRTHAPNLKRFVQISSLGVYPPGDHYGTDESAVPSKTGIDGYTLSKIESEELLFDHFRESGFPAVALRPGFIYGPRDRTILPRVVERLRAGQFTFLGPGTQLLNNTAAENLAVAVELALNQDGITGEAFNITDGRLVTRREFIEIICRQAGLPIPTRHLPLGLAKLLASGFESWYRLLGKQEAPLLSQARIKFLGYHLDYNIDKARQRLGYEPVADFQVAMAKAVGWLLAQPAG